MNLNQYPEKSGQLRTKQVKKVRVGGGDEEKRKIETKIKVDTHKEKTRAIENQKGIK